MSPLIFIDILIKNKILFFQCNFEADYDLACLANDLKCPLLSCDSDFFIYDLKYGYISMDYMDMNVRRLKEFTDQSDDYLYIPVRLYSLEKLIEIIKYNLKLNSFRKELLPIFAVLLGNDYVDKSIFNSLLETFDSTNNNLKFKKLQRNISGYAVRKNNHNKKLLEWLSDFNTNNDCIEQILKFIKSDKHDLVKKVINDSVNEYCLLKPSSAKFYLTKINEFYSNNLDEIFGKMQLNESKNDLNKDMITFNKMKLNEDFIDLFRYGKLTRFCLVCLIF
jgi:uncharacterized protein YeeX (DUF496 family)